MSEPVLMIRTAHFHNREVPLTSVLFALAAQENNDGDQGNAMQAAGDELVRLQSEIGRLRTIIRVNGLRWGHSHEDIDNILAGVQS
jgi:hypothetical protein